MLVIGIDPGITGSICFFEDGKIIDLIDMPNMADGKKKKKQLNVAKIYKEFVQLCNFPCILLDLQNGKDFLI